MGFISPSKKLVAYSADKPSPREEQQASSYGGSFYAGAGADDQSSSTSGTITVLFNYLMIILRGLLTFADLNGDYLRYIRDGGSVYYRPKYAQTKRNTLWRTYQSY